MQRQSLQLLNIAASGSRAIKGRELHLAKNAARAVVDGLDDCDVKNEASRKAVKFLDEWVFEKRRRQLSFAEKERSLREVVNKLMRMRELLRAREQDK